MSSPSPSTTNDETKGEEGVPNQALSSGQDTRRHNAPPLVEPSASQEQEESPPPPLPTSGAPPAQAHEATAIPPGGDTGKDSRKAVLGPLPLEWTQMGGNNEDFDKNPANVVRYPWDGEDKVSRFSRVPA